MKPWRAARLKINWFIWLILFLGLCLPGVGSGSGRAQAAGNIAPLLPPACDQPYCLYLPMIASDSPLNPPPDQPGINLAIQMTAERNESSILYTLIYRNYGPQPASRVTIVDDIPANTRFEPDGNDANWQVGSQAGRYQLDLGELAPGVVQQVDLAITMADGGQAGVETLTNRAEISADPSNGVDLDPRDNVASRTILIDNQPTVQITPPQQVNFNALTLGENVVSAQMTLYTNAPYVVNAFASGPNDWRLTEWDGSTYRSRRLLDPLVLFNPKQNLGVTAGSRPVLATGEATGPQGETIDLYFSQTLHSADAGLPGGETYHLVISYQVSLTF